MNIITKVNTKRDQNSAQENISDMRKRRERPVRILHSLMELIEDYGLQQRQGELD